jgi:isocitrate dehydrogenase kinase/phosphatase
MLEYEKYQDLQAKTQKTQEDYERQITELENQKEEEVSKKRMEYTSQLEKIKNDLILVSFFYSIYSNIVEIKNCAQALFYDNIWVPR